MVPRHTWSFQLPHATAVPPRREFTLHGTLAVLASTLATFHVFPSPSDSTLLTSHLFAQFVACIPIEFAFQLLICIRICVCSCSLASLTEGRSARDLYPSSIDLFLFGCCMARRRSLSGRSPEFCQLNKRLHKKTTHQRWIGHQYQSASQGVTNQNWGQRNAGLTADRKEDYLTEGVGKNSTGRTC